MSAFLGIEQLDIRGFGSNAADRGAFQFETRVRQIPEPSRHPGGLVTLMASGQESDFAASWTRLQTTFGTALSSPVHCSGSMVALRADQPLDGDRDPVLLPSSRKSAYLAFLGMRNARGADSLGDETRLETPTSADISAAVDSMLQKAIEAVPFSRVTTRLASFIGQVTGIAGEIAFVTALNEETQERFEAECDLSVLRANGIDEGMEFLCTLARCGRQTTVCFSPLPAKVLSEQQIERIIEEVDAKLT